MYGRWLGPEVGKNCLELKIQTAFWNSEIHLRFERNWGEMLRLKLRLFFWKYESFQIKVNILWSKKERIIKNESQYFEFVLHFELPKYNLILCIFEIIREMENSFP